MWRNYFLDMGLIMVLILLRYLLEVIKNESTLNEIASKNNVTPKNLQNWKKIFLDEMRKH